MNLRSVMIFFYIGCFLLSIFVYHNLPLYAEDVGKLLPTAIKEIRPATSRSTLKDWVISANKEKEHLTIAGMQHSQGGHTLYPGATMIDMKSYNKVIDYRPDEQRFTVQLVIIIFGHPYGLRWQSLQPVI